MKPKKKRTFVRRSLGKHISLAKRDAVIAELVATVVAGAPWASQRCGDYDIHVSRDEMGSIEVHDSKPYRFGYFHPSFERVDGNAVFEVSR